MGIGERTLCCRAKGVHHHLQFRLRGGAPVWRQPRVRAREVIGAEVWLGANVIVLCGVTIGGTGCVVAAGSVVTRNLPAGAVAVGAPARVVKMRDGSAVPLAG